MNQRKTKARTVPAAKTDSKKREPRRHSFEEWHLLFLLYRQKKRESRADSAHIRFGTFLPLVCLVLFCAIILPIMANRAQAVPFSPIGEKETDEPDSRYFTVTVTDGGKDAVPYLAEAITVGEFLSRHDITTDEDDELLTAADTVLYKGLDIRIDRIEKIGSVKEEQIPFETVTTEVQTVPRGERRTVQDGVPGTKEIRILTTYRNGKEEAAVTVSEAVVKDPVSAQEELGVGGTLIAGDGTWMNYNYYIDVSATAYGYPDEDVHITYSGIPCHRGTIAVDPTVIPLGTKVYVRGFYGDYGVCTAEDIGGGIKGNKIDVYMTYEEACEFGLRQMRAYILD